MSTIVRLYVAVTLNGDSELLAISGECNCLFIHPKIQRAEVIGVADIQGVACIEVNVTFLRVLDKDQIESVIESLNWEIVHESIDKAQLLPEFKILS
ncbi:hypothetical protein OTK49_21175 [Vibrio coralliirubri]|uniref:hypothetical protein n=1 Tax=Vibrio coralliirubri TaxID=1516159 RepID=UPI002283CBF2|nr:hypothetical protein [Vibrio coralliirubri]MCY9865033.1 hypothetical protein [Vibrio coralliirubri]